MFTRFLCASVAALCLVGCFRDPETAKREFVKSGNKFYEQGKYKEARIMYLRALEKDKKFGEAHYRQGLNSLKLNDFRAAAGHFQRAIEASPDNQDAYVQLIDLYVAAYSQDPRKPQQILDEARSAAGKLAKRFPDSYATHRAQGFLAMATNDAKTAEAELAQANRLKADQPEVAVAYARVLFAQNRAEEAEKYALAAVDRRKDMQPMYDLLVAHYTQNNRMADVESLLKRKRDANPKSLGPLVQLASLYAATNRRPEMEAVHNTILSRKADFPDGRRVVGDMYLQMREPAKAKEQFQAGLNEQPKDVAPYETRLAELAIRENNPTEARRLVDQMLKARPKDPTALVMRAGLNLAESKGDKAKIESAIADYEAANKTRRTEIVTFNIGRARHTLKDYNRARAAFEESLKLNPNFLPARLALAEMALDRRDPTSAQKYADEALALSPNLVPARLLRTRSLVQLGQMKVAQAELEKLVEAAPKVSDAQYQLAMVHLAQNQAKLAEPLVRRMEELKDPRATDLRIELAAREGQHAEARKLLEAELAKDPNRVDYWLALGNVASLAKDTPAAESAYRKALEKDPKSLLAHTRLAGLRRLNNDIPGAIRQLESARTQLPDSPEVMVLLAQYLDNAQRSGESRALYQQALKVRPDNVIALNNLAYQMAAEGQNLDQALTMAQRARKQVPGSPEIADTLGVIYLKKGLSDSAITLYQEVVRQQPNNATYRMHLAEALLQKGQKAQAKRELETALRSTPSKPDEDAIRNLMSKTI